MRVSKLEISHNVQHFYREEVKLLVASNSIIAIANCYSRVKLRSHVTGRCAISAQLQTIAYLSILLYIQNISGLFIDVGTNYSVLDHTNLSFLYEDVLSPGPNADGEFVSDINPSLFNVLENLTGKVSINQKLSNLIFTMIFYNVF